jgi:hypothetical protein
MVQMIDLLLFLPAAIAIVGVSFYVGRALRHQRRPQELRGDWWPRFEAEFRVYVRRWEMSGGGGQTQRKGQSGPARNRNLAEGL